MSGKTIVILQSNYIPWKGYFDLIAVADEFLLFDEAQFTKNDWRNRNRIALDGKLHWLTVPVRTAGQFGQTIESVEVSGHDWSRKHWETVQQAYRRAPFFKLIGPTLEDAYRAASGFTRLSEINEHFLRTIANLLDISTPIISAGIVPRTRQDPTERLLEICGARGATAYVTGPAARNYLHEAAFRKAGIALIYADYGGYPVYPQGRQPFEHGVSIVDLLMQCGVQTRNHLKAVSDRSSFLRPAELMAAGETTA